MNPFDSLAPEIPLEEAAGFFIKVKQADWSEAPDMTGALEGAFAVSVEEVIAKITEVATAKFRLVVAYYTYAESMRDVAQHGIGEVFHEHAGQELEGAEYYLKRAAVLGGPIHLGEVDPPPASSEPIGILTTLVRAEQEAISEQRNLHAMVGQENPMRVQIENILIQDQHHLDELWQMLPTSVHQELSAPPAVEAAPVEVAPAAEKKAPAEKTAAAADKPAPTDKELKETGRQRGVTALAAEAARERGRRGERVSETLGRLAGAVGGAAAGRKYMKGNLGTIAGLIGGSSIGGKAGKEIGTEIDLRKNASTKVAIRLSTLEKVTDPLVNKAVKASPFSRAASHAMDVQDKLLLHKGTSFDTAQSRRAKTDALRMLAGGTAKGSIPGVMGPFIPRGSRLHPEEFGKKASLSSALQRHIKKLAYGEGAATEEAMMPPPSPTGGASGPQMPAGQPTTEPMPVNYLAAEQLAQHAQQQNEAEFYRTKLREATGTTAAMQQQMASLQEQAQQAQQAQAESGAQIQQATQEAVMARDETLAKSQELANLHMATQKWRQQLMEIAAQDPGVTGGIPMQPPPGAGESAAAAGNAQGAAQQQAAAQAGEPDSGVPETTQGGDGGPAAKAPSQPNQPGTASPGAGGTAKQDTQNASGESGRTVNDTGKTTIQLKTGSAAAALGFGTAGALLGGLEMGAVAARGSAASKKHLANLQAQPNSGSFRQALQIAKAKANVAMTEAIEQYPMGAVGSGAISGGIAGAFAGPQIMKQYTNLKGALRA